MAVALTAQSAVAQDDLINDVWLAFGKHCGKVIEARAVDPTAFETLPQEHRISKSTDGLRVQVDHQTQDQRWSVSAMHSDLSDMRYIYCTVNYHNPQPLDDVDGLGAALRSRLEASGATAIAGGEVEDLKITSIYASRGSGVDQLVHMEAAGVLPDPDFIAQFQIYSYGLSVGTIAVLPIGEIE
ncbi:MAG: hypothetical protein AAF999_05525 [Pseudomonadota bacterium]